MKVINKIESSKKILELDLNRFPEQIFKCSQRAGIKNFIESYPAKYYAIRDKSRSSGVFKLKVESQDIMSEVEGYDIFSINVSSYNYVQDQLLVGEIVICDSTVSAILSTNKEYSVRDAIRDPDFNFITSIFDDKLLNEIPCFDKVYEYIVKHELQNVIVEFAYFSKNVGINNDNIIIYELRTHY